ncbi:hypothetical protein [Streptomyces sp. NPDC058084]
MSAFNLGTAAGSWVAGPTMVGATIAALALVPTITIALIPGRRSRPALG